MRQLRPHDCSVVVDAQVVAKGASGRNSGFMIDVPHNLSSGNYSVGGAVSSILEIRQNRLAIQFAAEAAAEYGMSAAAFDPMGKINAAATERGLRLNQDFGDSLARSEEHTSELQSLMRI